MEFAFQPPEPFDLIPVLVSIEPGGFEPTIAFQNLICQFQDEKVRCRPWHDLQHLTDGFLFASGTEMVGDDSESDCRGTATSGVTMDQKSSVFPQYAPSEIDSVPNMLPGYRETGLVVEIDVIER